MDVAIRAANLRFSPKPLARVLLFAALFLCFFGEELYAIQAASPLHWSGDQTFWDRKNNAVRLMGHAAVHQEGESITADRINLDLNTRVIDAYGHAVYITEKTVIYGEEMHFNMETRTGTIVGGRVSTESFTLTGERINKLGPGRFQTHKGSYTTCRDCPQSWQFYGEDVDMEIEGYARMRGVVAKVKDTPVLWVPYMIVPLKTQRQSGFLFPKFGFTDLGFNFLQPFFWATSRSTDMTFAFGQYGGRGVRGEWEGRYQLDAGKGQANLYYLKDDTFRPRREDQSYLPRGGNRWGLNVVQQQELPFGISEKLRIVEVSDNYYVNNFSDIEGKGQSALSSELFFNKTSDAASGYLAARRYRNIINPQVTIDDPLKFDPSTVQVYPTAGLSMNDRILFGTPISAGLGLGVTNFSRTAGFFDRDPFTSQSDPFRDYVPGVDPIRKATRVSATPSLYTTLRPWDVMSVVPSLEYRSFFYSFHNHVPNLTRGYLLFRTDFSTQLERIYNTEDQDIPRTKHLIRPILTYNLIPTPFINNGSGSKENDHPFLRQIEYAQEKGFAGYNFDNYDIVPLDATKTYSNYFVPLGNSVTYGFTTQLVRRRGNVFVDMPSYQRSVEFRTGQTYNFRELRKANPEPFSRFFAGLGLGFDKWGSSTDYSYTPYVPFDDQHRRHTVSTSVSYTFERSIHSGLFAFDRSFSLGYSYNTVGSSKVSSLRGGLTYSINDYILPNFSSEYEFFTHRLMNLNAMLRLQFPSRCWKLDIGFSRYVCPRPDQPAGEGICMGPTFDFALNLTGNSYGGVSGVSSQVVK